MKYNIVLSSSQKKQLEKIVKSGSNNARVITRARVLLKSEQGIFAKQIAKEERINQNTIRYIKVRFARGLESALYDAPRSGQPPKINEKAENHLVAIACSNPPEGRDRWTLKLLQEQMIKDGQVKTISTIALSEHLQKRHIKPRRKKKCGALPNSLKNIFPEWSIYAIYTPNITIP
jgi:transposase